MKLSKSCITFLAAIVTAAGILSVTPMASAQASTVLAAAESTKLLPEKVYFKGQSATTQLRNSGGVKFGDGSYVLATLVDTSGYSSDVQQEYQAYFITDNAIKIEGHDLPAGVYGIGFVAGDKFGVLDIGGHTLFSVGSHTDAEMKRPMPLKVAADGKGFRLYAGRKYVSFAR